MGNNLTNEQRHENMLKQIKNFRLLDDDFMTTCFKENTEAVELVLRIVLEKPDIKVEDVKTQYDLKNIRGRSVRLDIYAVDSENKKYNIEIQRADSGAGVRRARYNSSLIDGNILPNGISPDNISDTFIIFITENDVIGGNKPIYHIDRYIRELNEYFNDGTHIIYVNADYKDDSDLGKLMHDFTVRDPDEMNFKQLAKITDYYKNDKEGIKAMCKAMEDMITDYVTEEKKNSAIRMLKDGVLSEKQISVYSGLPMEVIRKIADEEGMLVK